ncbi:MAG: hypothetical protein CVT72_01095 [Alphaproteobacteria bacterium HGW-Alphaproteobacteria-11]|nr:MAG: hypothetical protein CVT72_01095 [Alphaproteobacteria bacterium HGW-Alphaproteobacteria-11]
MAKALRESYRLLLFLPRSAHAVGLFLRYFNSRQRLRMNLLCSVQFARLNQLRQPREMCEHKNSFRFA